MVLVPLVAALATAAYSWHLWGQVERVDTDGALAGGSDGFTNYLIVGVDSRDGVDAGLESADSIGLRVEGRRSDTMVILHVGNDGNRLISLPRDLWVDVEGLGGAKLNAATQSGGAPRLIRTVQSELGIPVHHYLEVNLAGFLSVVEAVGSITIAFDAAACDPKSGLDVRETGDIALEPEQALAYVRSRTYTVFDPGAAQGLDCEQLRSAGLGTTVGNADFGRTERQRRFLVSTFDKVAGTRNPITVLQVLSGMSGGLRVDDTMSMFDAFGMLQDLRGLNAETLALPVSDFSAPNGSAALTLNGESTEVLDLFR